MKEVQHRGTPRAATAEELRDIAAANSSHHRLAADEEWPPEWVAVFDNYITGGPGYAGPVIVVVWDVGPNCVTTFWRRPCRHCGHKTWTVSTCTCDACVE